MVRLAREMVDKRGMMGGRWDLVGGLLKMWVEGVRYRRFLPDIKREGAGHDRRGSVGSWEMRDNSPRLCRAGT